MLSRYPNSYVHTIPVMLHVHIMYLLTVSTLIFFFILKGQKLPIQVYHLGPISRELKYLLSELRSPGQKIIDAERLLAKINQR